MYLVHLPLVIAGQMLVVGWPIHYHLKFLLVSCGVTVVLLATYQFGVRYHYHRWNAQRPADQEFPQQIRSDRLN